MFGFAVGGLFFWIIVSMILGPFVTPPWWTAPLIWGIGFALSAYLNERSLGSKERQNAPDPVVQREHEEPT